MSAPPVISSASTRPRTLLVAFASRPTRMIAGPGGRTLLAVVLVLAVTARQAARTVGALPDVTSNGCSDGALAVSLAYACPRGRPAMPRSTPRSALAVGEAGVSRPVAPLSIDR